MNYNYTYMEALEEGARVVYEAMRFERKHAVPPWDYCGNSEARDQARDVARRLIDGVPGSFGWALAHAQRGCKIQRAGWNGKGMWVAMTPGSRISPELARAGAAQYRANELQAVPPAANYCDIVICPHLDMRAADGTLVIGWLASQTDMLADDWRVLE